MIYTHIGMITILILEQKVSTFDTSNWLIKDSET